MKRASAEKWIVKPAVFTAALVPVVGLTLAALTDRLGANPVETLTHETGTWALRILLVTLALTPIRKLTGWTLPVRVRRMLGLFAYFYICLHLLIYLVFDHFFAWADVVDDIIERPYITVGFLGFVLLTPLAATSTNAMIKRLGAKRWKRLHRLVYVAVGAGVVHFLWLVKADLREPLIYAALWVGLLTLRAEGGRIWWDRLASRFSSRPSMRLPR